MSSDVKIRVQSFGRFLSNMVMPNIGAFIAWGLITALFIPTGWIPNAILAKLVGPMITYLLPLLIGYTGGKMVGGDRGAVMGAIATMGVVVGADIPMFLGAMIVGPLSALVIKYFDAMVEGKIKPGFEMLVNNFSLGILGMVCALLAFLGISPAVEFFSSVMAAGVNMMIKHGLLPLVSIFVEPAKILFLNNAINHGIFTPLGTEQAKVTGQSIFFLIEANPGPGMGILLAYIVFGYGNAKQSAVGASIIHFFGGIHEIYFPYVLMNPKLVLAVIAGGMTNVFTLVLFHAGLSAPASPGSIFAVLLMTPKTAYLGVVLSVVFSCAVSFIIASILLKTSNSTQSLDEATSQMKQMKSGATVTQALSTSNGQVKHIVVACDAGMGSSAMGASMLRKKVQQAGLDIKVSNSAINSLPSDADLVITHQDLTERAKKAAPQLQHMSISNFLDHGFYDQLVAQFKNSGVKSVAMGTTTSDTTGTVQSSVFKLKASDIHLGLTAQTKEEAIRYAGEQLTKAGYVDVAYIDAMLAREAMTSTYLGESIAIPHGTIDAKDKVKQTGIVICQYPAGVDFIGDKSDLAHLVIGIAAKNNDHIQVITKITNALDDKNVLTLLKTTTDIQDVLRILG